MADVPPADAMLAFFVTAVVIIVVPGPSVLFVVSRALAHGRSAALASVVGNAIGCVVVLVLVALGLGAVVQSSQLAFTALKVAGALYLVWLGVQAIRHRDALDPGALAQAGETGPLSPVQAGRQGLVVGLTNPKVYVMFAALLPQFVAPEAGSVRVQILVLGAVMVLFGLVSDGVWAVAAARLRAVLTRTPRRSRAVIATGGATMIGLGAWLAVGERA